ncbi:MAG: hypothetical protein ACI4P0_01135 [Mailhella sp.]
MNEHELQDFLRAFHYWHEQAAGQVQRSSRTRMLFFCLLIRFTGMKMGEALNFNDRKDIDEDSCTIAVHGKAPRLIPLTRRSIDKLMELAESPAVLRERGSLCAMDQGYIRRVFEERRLEAKLPFHVSPSTLRKVREEELRRMGLPAGSINFLLGHGGAMDEAAEKTFRQALRYEEKKRHAGMHNVFHGCIADIICREVCARLTVQTGQGLLLHIRCSTRTVSQLGLEQGCSIAVFFRSLHGRIGFTNEGNNCFPARIIEAHEDGDIKFIMELDGGSKCCVIAEGAEEYQKLSPGSMVYLNIRDCDFMLRPESEPLLER